MKMNPQDQTAMKNWHNDRGRPWGSPYKGPDPITVRKMVYPNNLTVHIANEHAVDPDRIPRGQHEMWHAIHHMLGRFRPGQEHYHGDIE